MKKNHSEPDVVYEEGDVTALTYPTESFDIVFDKGTESLVIFWIFFWSDPSEIVLTSHAQV